MLSITVDNASNNDVMVSELEMLIPQFSAVNHNRCFLHVNNLVGRTLVKQFDVPKKNIGNDNEEDAAAVTDHPAAPASCRPWRALCKGT